jgi:hypothetical protein
MNRDMTYCTGEGCPVKDACKRYAKVEVFADIDEYTSWMKPPGYYDRPRGNALDAIWYCDYFIPQEAER